MLLLLSLNTFAQRVTYTDLKYLLYHNLSESEDFLINKGFSFDGNTTSKTDTNSTNLQFSKYPKKSNSCIRLAKAAIKGNYFQVIYMSYLLSDYLTMKSSIKKLGFKLEKTQTFGGSLVSEYRKGKILFSLWSNKEEGVDNPDYSFTIRDSDLSTIAFDSGKD